MKLETEILQVRTTGDKLEITVQGKAASEADWAAYVTHVFSLPDNRRTQRTFHVGRLVDITVTPRPERKP